MASMLDLASLADLDTALGIRDTPVVLYKHSSRCGVSAVALEEVDRFAKEHPDAARIYLLDLLAHRDVSDAVASRLGIRHESPQAIFLRDGRVTSVLNHGAIRQPALWSALEH